MVDYCMDQPHADNKHEWDMCSQEETCMKNVLQGHNLQEGSTVFGLTMEV